MFTTLNYTIKSLFWSKVIEVITFFNHYIDSVPGDIIETAFVYKSGMILVSTLIFVFPLGIQRKKTPKRSKPPKLVYKFGSKVTECAAVMKHSRLHFKQDEITARARFN